MQDAAYDRILAEVLDADEAGEGPVREALLSRHPGQEALVARVLADFERYRELRRAAAQPPAPLDLPPGTRLGDFELVGPLGRGGMGAVFRARQVSLGGRIVALKAVRAGATSSRGLERFRREASTLAGLHHPHLAEVHGFGEVDGLTYYAMRLVEGPPLREVLERRAASSRAGARDGIETRRRIVQRVAEIADALAAVHAAGLVHRDVKPSNVVFEDGDTTTALDHAAVLVDFGLVREVGTEGVTRTGDSPATPSYAAPEQLLGHEVDARADVFSLGVTLHDLLAARVPHERLQASAGLEQLREIVPGIDEDLSAIVAQAVDPEPDWRYPDAAALRDDLAAWLQGRPVTARHPPWTERTRRWIRRHPRRFVQALVAGMLALLAVIGGVLVSSAVGRVHSARDAWARQDLAAFERELVEVHVLPLSWLPIDDEQMQVFGRLQARAPDDALVQARDALVEGDSSRALAAVTDALAQPGSERDEAVEAFLLAAVRRRADPGQASEGRTWAIAAARLFLERPVFRPEEVLAFEAFRGALWEAWGTPAPDVDELERRYLVSALSGCGRPEDLPEVLGWARGESRSDEDARMALRCAERTLRRILTTGQLDRLDFAAVWARLMALLEAWDGRWQGWGDSTLPWSMEETLWDTARAALIAQRSREGPLPAVADVLPPDWQESSGSPTTTAPYQLRMESILLVDPALATGRLLPGLGLLAGGIKEDPELRGRLVALSGWIPECPPLEDWVSAVSALAAGEEQKFANGRERAEALLRGWDRERDPPGSHPADPRCPGVAEIPPEAAAVVLDPVSGPGPLPASAYRSFGGLLPRSALSAARRHPLASWVMAPAGLVVSGDSAGEASQVACRLLHDGPDNDTLLLERPGLSELRLRFFPPAADASNEVLLAIGLQTSLRAYLPSFGSAHAELYVNDQPAGRISTASIIPREQHIYLHASRLRQGVNTVRLRLSDDSETTLRLHWVEAWPWPPP